MSVCERCGWGDGRHARNCETLEPRLSYAELFGHSDPAYQRALDREKAKRDPRNQPIIACTSEDIDAGMFHMEHGYYPGEGPG